jgi:hypothetical protein
MAKLGISKLEISTKRLAINKANAQIVAVVGAASFITVFCLVASRAVWSQNQYQSRVTKADTAAHKQLVINEQSYTNLQNSYQAFISSPTNTIGGSSTGSGQNDGDNASIILDALPSSYDFPALTSSVEKILTNGNFTVSTIGGTDDQVAQQTNSQAANPQPVPMPFSFTVTNANYSSIQQLITTLQLSIRPIQIDSLTLSGGTNDMQLTVNAHTYYQPGKNLGITKQVVK